MGISLRALDGAEYSMVRDADAMNDKTERNRILHETEIKIKQKYTKSDRYI
jgi:hypothetical protein